MLEQKDFIDVENKYKESLILLQNQLGKGKISKEKALAKAESNLINLNHKLPILKYLLQENEIERIKQLIESYENLIDLIKSCENNIQMEMNNGI